ncbi:MAG: 1-deoxy-D-xylulose-5-phosphate synthase, partial [Candidatus Aminicenantes bacterium]|nr:1-deoxy-D-xylulose-5-phosphate synthase [Candidatus Aminicenantes bacterium]
MKTILDTIQTPNDLKRLSLKELSDLSREIRALILEVVSKKGGHLAPNLGVVELTLALHYVFDAPRDKIIWDVGHQCYTHKIITGRKDKFSMLRQYQGISGYPCREESEYDVYNTGHASTALSAAVGLAVAREKNNEDYNVIAVVGDGSLTGGVSWEALNQIGHLRERVIIVLNYNEMSISQNVGAMSKYLSYLVSGQHYLRIKDHAKSFLKSVPVVGWPMIKVGRAIEETIEKMIFPGIFFTELGIRYIGPVQGHSLGSLIEVFQDAKSYQGPILIHCVTKKGRGYLPAQSNPEAFHGTSPFDIRTGKPKNNDTFVTYSSIFGQTMVKLGKEDPKIVAITAAMVDGTGLKSFAEEFPERLFDVGIAEQHAVDFATGLALGGFKPVVAIYSSFLQRAYDQLYHDVCLMDIPVIFILDRAGIVADDGPTHQGVNDIIYLRHLPNMVVMAPKDENELQNMMKSALSYSHPVAIRFPKGKAVGVPLDKSWKEIPFGKGELLKEGENLILAFGSMVYPALKVAQRLQRQGISFAVVNARFAKPVDEELILRFAQPGRKIITLEEGVTAGGFGSSVRELLDCENKFDVRFKQIGLPMEVYPVGKVNQIKKMYRLDEEGLYQQILEFYNKIDNE